MTLQPAHVAGVNELPALHKDPFDRMLVAQAIAEELRLVTIDEAMRKYASPRLRVVS